MRKRLVFTRIDFENLRDYLYDYRMDRKHVIIECALCGQLLIPFIQHAGPRNCGWERLQGKHGQWICHQCYSHRVFEDPDEWNDHLKRIKKKNKKLIRQAKSYKWYHPWIRVKRL